MKPLPRWMRPLGLIVAGVMLLAGCFGVPPEKVLRKPVPFPPPPEAPRYFYERTVFGTGDVQGTTEEDRFRKLLTGQSKRTGMPFGKPFDVAVHKGRVFISDTVMQMVFALDFPQKKTFRIGDKGGVGGLGKPLGIAVDRRGNLYVVDNRQKRVVVYDRNGNFRTAFGGKNVLDRPTGIDVSPDGSRAYVVDVGGVRSKKHRVVVFDPRNGKVVRIIGTRGREAGQFNLPRDVALGPDGLLYVSDGANFRVQVFTTEGKFLREWGKPGLRFGHFSRPKGIATDPKGNVYVVDAAFGNFQIFSPKGQLLLFVGQRSERNGPGIFMLPSGIDIDEDGRIYVIDQFFRKLEIIRPAELQPEKGSLIIKSSKPQLTKCADNWRGICW